MMFIHDIISIHQISWVRSNIKARIHANTSKGPFAKEKQVLWPLQVDLPKKYSLSIAQPNFEQFKLNAKQVVEESSHKNIILGKTT